MYVALCDVHGMYSSVEAAFRPDLSDNGIAVASNGDGIVVALNSRAKQIGLKKFESVASQRGFFDSGQCTLFSSNYTLYASMSQRLNQCLRNTGVFADQQEYSIDESFGLFPACINSYQDLLDCARQLRRAAWRETRLPIGVGVGQSFTLSKAASFLGKKGTGYRGIAVLTPDNEDALLSKIPVDEVWNVGRATALLLKRKSVNTALDLKRVAPKDARNWMGVCLERTVRELRGEKIFDMNSFPTVENRKEVSSSISLTARATTRLELHQALSERISIAAEKLRKQKLTARHLTLFAQSDRFKEDYQSFYSNSSFEYPTDDTRLFIGALTKQFDQLYKDGVAYYKVGCRLLGIEGAENQQQDLFAPAQCSKLMGVMDALNTKFGTRVVGIGSQRVDSDAKMLRKHLSPNYLTEWADIPTIRC
ncbi:DinB/UmuC family translesion DNA polymerase [Vibrio agarivorans]|uniref:DUF4113 domain-containing protein n=1 Tax=Vibrio agarivorans TaxID=153622 RepID=A0ABT7Y798_9VIBR|nr:DUF4113 domain-containing protein [Vibrio agarivorans]MDN2483872.1 DUF4113 domain-containing protein [Vibrio agarivorans]